MKRSFNILMALLHFLLVSGLILLIYISLGYVNPGPKVEQLKYLSSATIQIGEAPEKEVHLPCTLWDLPARTPVTLTMTIYPEPDEEVSVESHCSPGKVYLNNQLKYEFGRDGQYPAFMVDPAPEVHMIETHGSFRAMEMRLEFLSPRTQRRMVLEAPLLGSTNEILMERFHAYGVPCFLAAVQIIYGFSLLLISVCTQFLNKKGVSFLWLGLLSVTTGMWAFGESEFSGFICKNSMLLYVCSFTGFFTFIIPLLRFVRAVVDFENPRPIWFLELFLAGCTAAAFLLQLTGLVSFFTSMHYFYLVLPVSLIFITGYTVREAVKFHSLSASRFILPVGILTLTALLGQGAYAFSSTYKVSHLTQLGILIFLLFMGMIAGFSIKDSIYFESKQKELNFEKNLMEIQAREQKNHSDLITRQEQMLSQQRHDLRHHLNVVKALAKNESTELQEYLQTLMQGIPTASRRFCENQAVNAIVSHYSELCRQKGIELTLNLTIPDQNANISDSSLCVIFGNLLENAVEACDRMTEGHRFISLKSKTQYEMLAITMDNSFDGVIKKDGDRFRSSKRDDFGIGLSSVCSAARKAHGNATYRTEGGVFYSSVYLNL